MLPRIWGKFILRNNNCAIEIFNFRINFHPLWSRIFWLGVFWLSEFIKKSKTNWVALVREVIFTRRIGNYSQRITNCRHSGCTIMFFRQLIYKLWARFIKWKFSFISYWVTRVIVRFIFHSFSAPFLFQYIIETRNGKDMPKMPHVIFLPFGSLLINYKWHKERLPDTAGVLILEYTVNKWQKIRVNV